MSLCPAVACFHIHNKWNTERSNAAHTILQDITGNVTIGGSGRDDGRGAIKVTSGSTANITGGTITQTGANTVIYNTGAGTIKVAGGSIGANVNAKNNYLHAWV